MRQRVGKRRPDLGVKDSCGRSCDLVTSVAGRALSFSRGLNVVGSNKQPAVGTGANVEAPGKVGRLHPTTVRERWMLAPEIPLLLAVPSMASEALGGEFGLLLREQQCGAKADHSHSHKRDHRVAVSAGREAGHQDGACNGGTE